MSKLIPLTKGQFAIVDDEDFEWLSHWKWQAHSYPNNRRKFAARRSTSIGSQIDGTRKGINLFMHRMILSPPPGFYIDHKNNNPLDNRRENLRICTCEQNAINWDRPQRILPRGVYQDRRGFRATIRFANGTRRSLGTFSTPADAAKAYNAAAKAYHGEFARLNCIEVTKE